MNKLPVSILTIVVAMLLVVGGTGAFFNDSEMSSGNTFAAGVIDLTVDNESYYNGAVSTSTTWLNPVDLDEGTLFFNFRDVKPDDEGEDTISLHVATNDAWACMDISLTSNDDVSSNEPELATGDVPEDSDNTWDGELAQHLEFVWWADDGDNVYEVGEHALYDGVKSLNALLNHGSSSWSVALADSAHNVWTPDTITPMPAEETRYLAKAWCFGTLAPNPVAQDGLTTIGPLDGRGTGFTCNGEALGNETQTDTTTLNVAFRVMQARDQEDFLCDTSSRMAELTVVKQVVNDNGGNNVVSDFPLFVTNSVTIPATSGATTTLVADTYRVTEQGLFGYTGSFGGDCDSDGYVTLNPGDHKTCTITNNDNPASIYLFKQVINDNGGIAQPFNFVLRVDGAVAPQGSQVVVTSNTPHTISEDARLGYQFVTITTLFSIPAGIQCPATLGGTVTLEEGAIVFCQITNDDIPN